MFRELKIGDTLRLKKPHPCGGYEWEIIRLGTDIRIKCLKCGHTVLVDRSSLEKRITAVRPRNA